MRSGLKSGFFGFATAAFVLMAVPGSLPASADAADKTPQFVTLGTAGGPGIHVERSQPANAVVVGDAVYLFDVGVGVQRQMRAAGLTLHQVRAIFISHHHLDHNAGLGPVLMNRWLRGLYKPIPVIGPPGTVDMTANLAAAFQPTVVAPIMIDGPTKPPIPDSFRAEDLPDSMDAPQVIYEDENIRVLAITNNHYNFTPGSLEQQTARSYSYRIESHGRSIVYTGDTGPSANLERLARGADLLVTEVIDLPRELKALERPEIPPAMREGLAAHMRLDHLTPTAIAEIASKAGIPEVVLTHLVPSVDGDPDLSGFTDDLEKTYKGTVHIANDLNRF